MICYSVFLQDGLFWWLVDCHLSGCFCLFALWFWEGSGNLWMIFCQSMSAVWEVSTLKGGRDTWPLTAKIEFVWTFCTQEFVGMLKHCSHAPCTLSGLNEPSSDTFITYYLLQTVNQGHIYVLKILSLCLIFHPRCLFLMEKNFHVGSSHCLDWLFWLD